MFQALGLLLIKAISDNRLGVLMRKTKFPLISPFSHDLFM